MYCSWGWSLSVTDIIDCCHCLPYNLEMPLSLRLPFIRLDLINFLALFVFLQHEHGQKVKSALNVCQIDDIDLFSHFVCQLFMIPHQPCVTFA